MTGAPPGPGRGIAWAGGAMVSLASAVGIAVGLPSVVAVELPGLRSLLRLPPLENAGLGVEWSGRVVWPAELQDMALERMAGILAALLLAVASVALLNALVLLVEGSAARRREMAVRAAVGAGPGRLFHLLVGQVRVLVGASLALGLLLGLAVGGVLRGAWPALTEGPDWVTASAVVVPALVVLCLAATGAYVWVGVSVGRRTALAAHLLSGGRVTADRGEAFRRRALSALQMGAAGAVSVGALALAMSVSVSGAHRGPDGVVAIEVHGDAGAPPQWGVVLAAVEHMPGIRGVTLASPGALLGLGVRDNAVAQCGNCFRGGLPLPFWGARADHHAVAPGFFAAAGLAVLAGRDFTTGDGPGAKRVALVNRTFANTAFEKGQPLGRLVRLGRDLDAWYEVVGVVEDQDRLVLGRDDIPRAEIYVSALQHPVVVGDVLVRGDGPSVAAALDGLAKAGLRPGQARTLDEVMDDAAAPVLWAAGVATVLGLLTLVFAIFGAHTTSLQITRRRTPELAVRRVLGARDARITWHVLSAGGHTALWGSAVALFLGTLLVALLRKVASGVPAMTPAAYLGMAALLVGTSVLASARAGREALSVEPADVLE